MEPTAGMRRTRARVRRYLYFPKAATRITENSESSEQTENCYGKGDTCDGDNGGPDFYYDGSKYLLFGQHALYPGTCGSGQNTNVATRHVATWIQHIAGTLR